MTVLVSGIGYLRVFCGPFTALSNLLSCFYSPEEKTVEVPVNQVGTVVPFLAGKPAVVIRVVNEESDDNSLVATGPYSSPSPASCEIWVKNAGKPTPIDEKARDDLIGLYGSDKYKSLFTDKRTTKKNVWDAIGKEIVCKGYNFGERDPGKVCSQKWRNMESETQQGLKILEATHVRNLPTSRTFVML